MPQSSCVASRARVVRKRVEVAEGADVLVILTEGNEFRATDLKSAREIMLGNCWLICGNVVLKPWQEAGYVYNGYRPYATASR